MSKTCSTIRELRDRVAEHYGKEAVQLTLYLPKRQSTDGRPLRLQKQRRQDIRPISTKNKRGRQLRRPYFGGSNSPFNQPVALSVFNGSGRSQSKHWNVRGPSPPGGSARIKKAPQLGQVGRLAWPMRYSMTADLQLSVRSRTRNPKNPRSSIPRRGPGRVGP